MRTSYRFGLVLLLLVSFSCKTRKLAQTTAIKASSNFRVVGYMLSGEIAKGQVSNFDISRLTYLNVFFNGPGTNGKFKNIPHLDSVINVAHQKNVKVLATIGNGVSLSLLTDTN